MDLEIEQRASFDASVEINGELTPESGSYPADINVVVENICETAVIEEDSESLDSDLKPVNEMEPTIPTVNSPRSSFRSSDGSSPVMRKHGLRKWRRIRRDFIKDASPPNIDNFKILKRASSSMSDPTKPHTSAETTKMSESVGSVNNLIMNPIAAESSAIANSNLDSQAATSLGFSLGMNSEVNDDDGGSKSSTATSTPNMRYDLSAVSREKSRKKNSGDKAVYNLVQQGKGKIRTSKKPKGERVNVNKKNSCSSVESYSRSSNFIVGKRNGRSINPDGENGEVRKEKQFKEEYQSCSYRDNVEQFGNHSHDKDERRDNHGPFTGKVPLDDSVIMLQYIQAALEKEVEQLGEIGRKFVFTFNASLGSSPDITNESGWSARNLEMQVVSLKEKIKYLENRLNSKQTSSANLEDEDFSKDMETMFKHKIESEVVLMVITQKLSVDALVVKENRLIRVSSSLLVQLILILGAFWVFVSQFSTCADIMNIPAPT